jgi:hypothetical protein
MLSRGSSGSGGKVLRVEVLAMSVTELYIADQDDRLCSILNEYSVCAGQWMFIFCRFASPLKLWTCQISNS